MSGYRYSIRATILLIALLTLGCTNDYKALRLSLSADKPTFRLNEKIGVTATLTTGDQPVILSKQRVFLAEMTKVGDPVIHITYQERAFCGMRAMALLFFPWVIPFLWMDIADLQGNFDVLAANQKKDQHLDLHVYSIGDRAYISEYPSGQELAVSPGTYNLTIKFDNQYDPGIVPPLFWKPYDHTLSSRIEIEIADSATSNSTPAK